MRFFGDHMILLSGNENRALGKAPVNEKITLKLSDNKGGEGVLSAVADEKGG